MRSNCYKDILGVFQSLYTKWQKYIETLQVSQSLYTKWQNPTHPYTQNDKSQPVQHLINHALHMWFNLLQKLNFVQKITIKKIKQIKRI